MRPLWRLLLLPLGLGLAQSNYNKQAISIEYEGEGLPLFGTLNGTVTELDNLPPSINLNRTGAELGCSSGYMNVALNFKQPFYGIVYADFDRNSACKITGNGQLSETIKLPLKGCGTLQSPARVFKNNIIVRFHPGLEIDGDEVITIICRYPPPIVPVVPNILPEPVIAPEVPTLAPLREFEILLIICAIIFLALLLLGIGCSYYCLKKRNIKVVRRRPASTLGSDITKLSDPPSMFGGLKIPRAHATDTSGSEELTESINSDFPSEVASAESEEEYHSAYSDQSGLVQEGIVLAQLHEPPKPGFDVRTAVKYPQRAISPASTTATSESELVLKAQEQYLTTILERTETNTLETLERVRKVETKKGPPPVHARIRVQNKQVSEGSGTETESEYSQGNYFEDDLYLESKDMRNIALARDRAEFDVHISSKYDNLGYSHSEDDTSTVYSDAAAAAAAQRASDAFRSERYVNSQKTFVDDQRTTTEAYRTDRYIDDRTHRFVDDTLVHRTEQFIDTHGGKYDTHSSYGTDTPRFRTNFDVLIRILDQPAVSDRDEVSSVFTEDERVRLREFILHDENVQSILETTHHREEFLLLKNHEKIVEIVEPQKWDVLIRVLQNYDDFARSETRSEVTRTSSGAAQELRSMSEVMVDFSNTADYESRSLASSSVRSGASRYTQGARSVADRSGTEIIEYHTYSASAAAAAAYQSAEFHEEKADYRYDY